MTDNTEDVKGPFEFKASTVNPAVGDALEVDVMNVSGAAWDGFLFIELKLPTKVVAPKVGEAALESRQATAIQNMASLAGVVTAAEGWSVWAINYPNDSVVVIRVFNGINQQDGEDAETNTPLDAGAVLKVRIPLAPTAVTTQFEMEYGYQTGAGTRVDGSLMLTPSRLGKWEPKASLVARSQRNATMIDPGTAVDIEWSVTDGVAATLRGPLPGGNSELTLSRDTASDYRIDKGSMTILAVGPATYVLDAEVKGPEGQPNVQVVRTLAIDIYSPNKYANVSVHPEWVLPNGEVEIKWAVWGVEKAALKVGSRDGIDLELTEQNLHRTYQGSGTLLVHAANDKEVENVSLTYTNAPKRTAVEKAEIQTSPWVSLKKAAFTGKPVALAVADGNMALLTSDGLYTGQVGRKDLELKSKLPAFVKSAVRGKAWHALADFGNEFVVLRRTDGDDVVLERYDGKGQRVGLPVTLHDDFQTLARRDGTHFELVGLGKRVYVVAEAPVFGRSVRSAYSVRFDPDVNVRPEARLAQLLHYRLLGFGGALYAYHRGTGRMLRFGLKNPDELDEPRKSASAVNAEGVSMIKTGLLVPVGSVLTVLDPAALPSFESLRISGLGLNNVLDAALKCLKEEREPNEIPQDLCYNPQHNTWTPCGHGLDIQAGAVASFRGGASKRLWVLQPDGTMHTLTSAKEELFAPDFLDRLHPKDLPPVLDSAREFTLVNLSGIDLVPVDATCVGAGLDNLGAEGPAELKPSPDKFPNASNRRFTVSYSKTDTTEVKLRFMAANPPGVRYLLEVSLTGEGLGRVTTAFRRLNENGQLADVPDTFKEHPAGADKFTLIQAGSLLHKRRLFIANGTTRDLNVSPRAGSTSVPDSAWVDVAYDTPDIRITVPGVEKVGMVGVNFDLALPFGIEMSPGGEPQRMMMRVKTDNLHMLDVETHLLNKYFTAIGRYLKYDGSYLPIGAQPEDVCGLRVGLKTKKELDGVRIGDGAATRDGKSIFVTLARPEDVKKIRIMRIDTDSIETSELAVETRGNVYSVPNAVGVSDNYYYAMFGETVWHQATRKFEFPFQITLDGFKEIVAFTASAQGHVYYVSKKEQGFGDGRQIIYALWYAPFPNHSKIEIPIQPSLFANAIPTLAVSPDGNTAALCDVGGLIVVDVTNKSVQPFRPGNLREPGHAVFSPDGRWIYCVHLTSSFNVNPRRVVSGSDINVTRVRVGNLNERQSLSLPNVEGNFSVTANTKQSFGVNVSSKEQVALTLAVSPDNRFLFVSAGTSIMRIATDSFTLQPWRANVELPSRLVCVKSAGANAYTVYALGSYYRGDGIKVEEYKTHLYAVPAPVA